MATLNIPAELGNLGLIARFVETEAGALQAGREAVEELIQAVDEAATNVILHGYHGHPGQIEIEISRENETLIVRIRDQAPFFDVRSVPPPDLSLPLGRRRSGGLGVFLMRHFTDEIVCRELPEGGNELTLYKLAPRDASAPEP